MTLSVRTLYRTVLFSTAIMVFATTAQAAGYLKLDGIDGESKRAQSAKVEKARVTPPPRAGIIKKDKKGKPSHTRGDEHEIEYDIAR